MDKNNTPDLMPLQPYVVLNTQDYVRLFAGKTGISHFYEFTVTGEENPLQAVPDGTVDLVFGMNEAGTQTMIGGTVLSVKNWPLEEGRTYFGVRFQPGRCVLPEELTIQDIVNDDLELTGKVYGSNLADQIAECPSFYGKATIFNEYYQKYMEQKKENTAAAIESYIRTRIYATNGTISIRELAQETGYSECYIRRVFHEIHGISPKVFEKIVRFQHVLKGISEQNKEGQVTANEIALDCGYYDQSHMMKDFKRYTGVTPEAYARMIDGKL
ncbi:MAG: helix-turn-helix domain-containing protein [Lachnospiraceae bacterium]